MNNKLDHIALILDGNKRWAKKNNLTNFYGYSKGFENIKNVVKYCLSLKLSNLTIFALSSENYNRSSINTILNLNIAFNYGFKDEIKFILKNIQDNKTLLNLETEEEIKNLFYLGKIADPDLLIRTGGHQRLSNFIMYNLTYTELFFTKTLWPDFSENELKSIINEYNEIDRKYGL